MYYSVFENSIIMEAFFFFLRGWSDVWLYRGCMLGVLCGYFHGVRTLKCSHASGFESVCLCVSVSMCDRASSWVGGLPLINVDLSLWRQWSCGEKKKNTGGRRVKSMQAWWRSSARSLAVWKVHIDWKPATGKWFLQTQWEFIISTQGEAPFEMIVRL